MKIHLKSLAHGLSLWVFMEKNIGIVVWRTKIVHSSNYNSFRKWLCMRLGISNCEHHRSYPSLHPLLHGWGVWIALFPSLSMIWTHSQPWTQEYIDSFRQQHKKESPPNYNSIKLFELHWWRSNWCRLSLELGYGLEKRLDTSDHPTVASTHFNYWVKTNSF